MTTAPAPDVVVASGIDYHYDEYHAVRNVSLTVRRGEIFALLGTNGAGKTTTLELLQGFRGRTSGDLTVFGVDPHADPATVRARTGVVLQESGHFGEITVRAELTMWASLSSRTDSVDRVLDLVELTHRSDSRIDSLSGGERRRLDLAMAIWGSPELIVLDEPTTGLDPESRRTLWGLVERLRDEGTTIILTTHYLEEAEELADVVAIMHQGALAVHGTLDEVLASRPSRIQVDVRPADGEALMASAPEGVHASWDTRRRPSDPTLRVLEIVASDQQKALTWTLGTADRLGLDLGPLRANPASLDEVFHHVRNATQEVTA
ncbi:multidrug ABC transporter ATP-binding protein [Rhodococcoides trifolii]|uniref:Multidrug ABC transporter ATP-binding protein n=1 Tax=Rhodococcoides trifolii TaxID=908250 RepID=A0A917CT26_9NOCA|nr:ABC transporter ATP-binding protein [Rhodococcus trifolii]GGF97928.1 multidrug ABC transporter ATP-binding protein [Rhodococcus trifolii]